MKYAAAVAVACAVGALSVGATSRGSAENGKTSWGYVSGWNGWSVPVGNAAVFEKCTIYGPVTSFERADRSALRNRFRTAWEAARADGRIPSRCTYPSYDMVHFVGPFTTYETADERRHESIMRALDQEGFVEELSF